MSPAEDLETFVLNQFCDDLVPYIKSPNHPDDAEKRVLRQFVEALLFEQIVPYEIAPYTQCGSSNSSYDAVFNSVIRFSLSNVKIRCIGVKSAFDRVRIAQGSIQVSIGNDYQEARLIDVICYLDTNLMAKKRLLQELKQTTALVRWNSVHLAHNLLPRRELDYQVLESAITEGHLYHPCFKARTGFTLDDHRTYGPEAGNRFQLRWLAIASNQVNKTLNAEQDAFWSQELGSKTYLELTSRLKEKAKDWSSMSLMPIHPWQFKSVSNLGLSDAIAIGDIVDLGQAGDYYQAGQSLRTLLNVTNPRKSNIKLPLNLISTSSHRNFIDHFVCTAPTISYWLQEIVAKDAYLKQNDHLLLLSEYAAQLHKPTDNVLPQEMDGRIGVIFRQSVIAQLRTGEQAIPFTALNLVESDSRPFIDKWLQQYGEEYWLSRLIDVVVIPIWHLLVHHGVALEAHAQNLILIHRNGWPERIAVRDFHESIEYVESFLPNDNKPPAVNSIDPYFDSVPVNDGFNMSDVDALRELYMDTVYVFNLADLSFLLHRYSGLKQDRFWNLLKKKLEEYQSSNNIDIGRVNKVKADSPVIAVESLLKKKIKNGGSFDYFSHQISNPLAE